MRCPICKNDTLIVITTQYLDDCVRRRRLCLSCGRRFWTRELIIERRNGDGKK